MGTLASSFHFDGNKIKISQAILNIFNEKELKRESGLLNLIKM